MRRFWKSAGVVQQQNAFHVTLDDKPLKNLAGQPITVPFEALARGIAAEWAAAGQDFERDDFPFTRLVAMTQDRVSPKRSDVIRELAAYGMNDLLCYRANYPPALVEREVREWQPWIDWADQQLGIGLKSTSAILPIEQPSVCLDRFITRLMMKNDYQLAGLRGIVPALGSLVLGLAIEAGALAPDAACECANLGELWHEMRWGTDAETVSRRQKIAEDVLFSAAFLRLCRA